MKVQYVSKINVKLRNTFKLATVIDSNSSKFPTAFDSNSTQQFLTHILFSTAKSSSLCDPNGISTGKTSLFPAGDTGTIPYQSLVL